MKHIQFKRNHRFNILAAVILGMGLVSCSNTAMDQNTTSSLEPLTSYIIATSQQHEKNVALVTQMREHVVSYLSSKQSVTNIKKALDGLTSSYTLSPDGTLTYDIGNKLDFTNTALIYDRFKDLYTLSQAYVTEPKKYASFLPLIEQGLQIMHDKYYHVDAPEKGNWWTYEIGSARYVNKIVLVLYHVLSPSQLKQLLDAVFYFQPDPFYSGVASGASFSSSPDLRLSTGGNRLDTSLIGFYHGLATNNLNLIKRSLDAAYEATKLVKVGDGFHQDGSFIQHTVIGYNGTYGKVLLDALYELKRGLDGTPIKFGNADVEYLINYLGKNYSYLMAGDRITDAVSGRANWKYNTDLGDKYDTLLTRYNRKGSSSDYDRGKEFVTRFKTLGVSITDPVDNHYFYAMDKLVARNADHGVVVLSMHSNRIANTETINGDNPYGLYQNDGQTYIYGKDQSANVGYTIDANPKYLPGITEVEQDHIHAYVGERRFSSTLVPQDFVGGINSADNVQFVGFDFLGWDNNLSVQKSYIANNRGIVVYGYTDYSGGSKLYTVIDQRRLQNYVLKDSSVVPVYDKYVQEGMTIAQAQAKYVAEQEKLHPSKAQVFVDGKPITKTTHFATAPQQILFVDDHGTKIGYQLYQMPNLDIVFENGFVRFVSYGTKDFSYGIYPQTVSDPNYNTIVLVKNASEQVFYDPNTTKTYMNFFTKQVHSYKDLTVYGSAQVIKYFNNQGQLVLELNDPTKNMRQPLKFTLKGKYSLVSHTTAVPHYDVESDSTSFYVDLNTKGKSQTLVLNPMK